MKAITQFILTVVIAVVVTCAIGFLWLRAKPAPRVVQVDLISLFDEQKAALEKSIKPGMSKEEQSQLLAAAAAQANRIDAALTRLVNECDCAVMNSAAIAKLPSRSDAGIRDATGRVRAILAEGAK